MKTNPEDFKKKLCCNYFDLKKNNKDIILNNDEYNDEYSDEYRPGVHSDKLIIFMDILRTIVIIHGY